MRHAAHQEAQREAQEVAERIALDAETRASAAEAALAETKELLAGQVASLDNQEASVQQLQREAREGAEALVEARGQLASSEAALAAARTDAQVVPSPGL